MPGENKTRGTWKIWEAVTLDTSICDVMGFFSGSNISDCCSFRGD